MRLATRLLKKREGFSLVEIMTSTALILLFSGAFFGTFSVMHRSLNRQNAYFDTNRAARFSLERIAIDAKEAVSLVTTLGGDTTGNTVLILGLPSIDAFGIPTDITSDFDFVTYKMSGVNPNQFIRVIDILDGTSTRNGGVDETRVVANNVANVFFSDEVGTGLSAVPDVTLIKRINVLITSSRTTLNTAETTQLDADIMLRNRFD